MTIAYSRAIEPTAGVPKTARGIRCCRSYFISFARPASLYCQQYVYVYSHNVRHPLCVLKLTRMERLYLSNTTLFDGTGMCRIYYIKYNYMFRRLTMAISRLYMKYLASSYTTIHYGLYAVGVEAEVCTRPRMCYGGGRCGYIEFCILYSIIQWWDVTREGTYQGLHTKIVTKGLRWGIILFIVSEVLFFVSFFWAFFHSRLSPTIELGSTWPPTGIQPFNPLQVPLLNTAILLASGVTVTWAHHGLLENNATQATQGLFFTVLLGLYFTFLFCRVWTCVR